MTVERPSNRSQPQGQGKGWGHPGPVCLWPTSSEPPTSLFNSKWTMDSTSRPPQNLSWQHVPSPRTQLAPLHQLPGLGKETAEEKHFTSCPAALDNCLSRHYEKSPGPRALLCTCWGTWPDPPSLWTWDPTSPSLLTRTCCSRSWHSVLLLEFTIHPLSLPLF